MPTAGPNLLSLNGKCGAEPRMRTVLCYGDSNTHGQIPGGTLFDRYPYYLRWPGVLARELGKEGAGLSARDLDAALGPGS